MAITDNIVAYWKLDESSGNATDATGNGFTLTNTNTVSYSTGLINNGANFGATSNSNKALTTANNLGIDGGNVTISAWYNPAGTSNRTILGCGSVTSQVLYYMQYTGSAGTHVLELHRWKVPGSDIKISSIAVTAGVWNHIVLTYDGSTLAGYLNNSAISGTSTSGSGTSGLTSQTSLGGYSQLSSFAPGIVDEVGVWSRVLSAGEVSTIYNAGVGLQYPFIPPAPTGQPSFLLNFC